MPEYSGLKIDPFGDILVCPRMKNANVIHRVLENKQSLLELHSADGASFYFTYIYLYFKQYNYRMYQTQEIDIYLFNDLEYST